MVDRWHEALATVTCTPCRPHGRPHLQKVVRSCQFFTIFMWNRALATVWCTFCRPHLEKVPKTVSFFLTILMWNQALASVSCTLCQPHVQKVPKTVIFFTFFYEIEFWQHFVDHFPDRGAHLRKQRLSSGNCRQPLYQKKHRVLRPRIFSAVKSRVPDRLHFPTTSWWCD